MTGTFADSICFSSLTLLKMWVKPSAEAGLFSSQSPNFGTAAPLSGCHVRNYIILQTKFQKYVCVCVRAHEHTCNFVPHKSKAVPPTSIQAGPMVELWDC